MKVWPLTKESAMPSQGFQRWLVSALLYSQWRNGEAITTTAKSAGIGGKTPAHREKVGDQNGAAETNQFSSWGIPLKMRNSSWDKATQHKTHQVQSLFQVYL